jgi:predicted SAM-dependent methyltransferase
MKLHLGCGKRFLKGFVHVDIEKFSHVDFVSKLHELEAFPGNSISEIYCSHAISYYSRSTIDQVLREWFRILAPKGKVFLTAPNFDSLIQIYNQTKSLGTIIGPLFGEWKNTESILYHRTVWTFTDLKSYLLKAGFINVEEFEPIDFLASIDPEYDDFSLAYFPHMDRNGIKVSLAVSAEKPLQLN